MAEPVRARRVFLWADGIVRHEPRWLVVPQSCDAGRFGGARRAPGLGGRRSRRRVFADVVAAAMIDRLVHHAEVLTTNGTQSCN
jgi:hypothetical protein